MNGRSSRATAGAHQCLRAGRDPDVAGGRRSARLPEPGGRKTISQHFNAGVCGARRQHVPAGTNATVRLANSLLSPLRGLPSFLTLLPTFETVGYFRTSLTGRASARRRRGTVRPPGHAPDVGGAWLPQPVRAKDNSPAFQRWVSGRKGNKSRQGRKNTPALPTGSFVPEGLGRACESVAHC